MLEFPAILLGLAAVLLLPMGICWAIAFVFKGSKVVLGGAYQLVTGLLGRTLGFARGVTVDSLHAVGSGMTAGAMLPLSAGNLVLGRPAAARSYGTALGAELRSLGTSLYRLAIGHPARFFGFSALTDGLERRLPETIENARRSQEGVPSMSPRAAFAALRNQQAEVGFEGYTVESELPAGGSGARLYLATPDDARRADWRAAGYADPGQVVIKSFDLEFGSTLPQIVRENRALVAARRLGLVLEHELSSGRFHYVMPFVPGEGLDKACTGLHERSGSQGLDDSALRSIVGYGCDLAATLGRFHREGLWHKDVKPSNLIVSDGRLHVVDLGLVTPLASSLTLTTHGTEYYRDPEMVRLAMQGVKVHEVDGVKFDIYSTGAVLYSVVENSFPAHGSLSRISKRCPDALAWIIRRCMADLATRYASADELGRDLAHVLAAENPFTVLPATLPSVSRRSRGKLPSVPPAPRVRAKLAHLGQGQRQDPGLGLAGQRAAQDPSEAPSNAPGGSHPQPRRGRRVVARVLVGGAILGGLVLIAADDNHHSSRAERRSRRLTNAALDNNSLAMRFLQDEPNNRVHSTRALDIRTQDKRANAGSMRPKPLREASSRRGHAQNQLPPALAEALPRDSGGVLILREPGVPGDREDLLQLAETLQQQGHVIYGLGDDGDEGLTLEARARKAVGLVGPDDSRSVQALEMLLAQEPRLGTVLWTHRDGEEDGLLVYPVVSRP